MIRHSLMQQFGTKRVRIYTIDPAFDRLIMQVNAVKDIASFGAVPFVFSSQIGEDDLSLTSHTLKTSLASLISSAKEAIFVHDPSQNSIFDSLIGVLYQKNDLVLAAPIHSFKDIDKETLVSNAHVLAGFVEVVIPFDKQEKDASMPSKTDSAMIEFSAGILEQYLFFECRKSIEMHVKRKTERNVSTVKKDTLDLQTKKKVRFIQTCDYLVLKCHKLELLQSDCTISELIVSTILGKLVIHTKKVHVGDPISPRAGTKSIKAHLDSIKASIHIDLMLANIPHGCHILIESYCKGRLICWTGMYLFDFTHTFQSGLRKLWLQTPASSAITALDIGNCTRDNHARTKGTGSFIIGSLCIEFEGSHDTLSTFHFGSTRQVKTNSLRATAINSTSSTGEDGEKDDHDHTKELLEFRETLEAIKRDSLFPISKAVISHIWSHREALAEDAGLLPAFLLSIDWSKHDAVIEGYRLLKIWKQPSYLQALRLLSPSYADPKVRAYAVRCLHSLPDHRLKLYLLQLVQALKNERYHDSALARFLFFRGLSNPADIGYPLFWFLQAEVQFCQSSARFQLLIDQYVELCGIYKLEIRQSMYVMKKLEEIAAEVKLERSQKARNAILDSKLGESLLPDTFQLPLHARTFCSGFVISKCRVLESKKKPLYLVFENARAQLGQVHVIFKSGDDLRQDQLVIQLLRVMDDLWQEAGMNLCLTPYSCIATGVDTGLIEVVQNAETLAAIVYGYRGKLQTSVGRKLIAVKDALMSEAILSDWLFCKQSILGSLVDEKMQANEQPVNKVMDRSIGCFPLKSPRKRKQEKAAPMSPDSKERKEITQNFLRSCAGYCVATYVLGIGDRHNDNLMLQRNGKFFHIDFGHFLGNFKSKLGVKRERAPFVLTHSMIDVIGGEHCLQFQEFQRLACGAFKVLRLHSDLLITLIVSASSCGIPELRNEQDVRWLHKTVMLEELLDEKAETRFRDLIRRALRTKTTLMNDAVHLMAH
uniref:Phosphatidyl inositol kinase (PIKB) putative n=1 Tax=Albugo laibachii Nc14 TaxID=890382 RepID=F0WIJ2_9STRA|nr:phosphatidyl inositol kinase (PIKB) putative [Albugo laibachii Nc14]|eukprot:CCA21074.1 phosphatidyl inositol kinase (PIKB) putative [Albugo laibachii Nc14]